MTEAVIIDVDGTLCDVSGVRHYVEGTKRDFTSFHGASLFCPPIDHVVAMARSYHRGGLAVLVVTAREERFERVTRDWLHKHRVPHDRLYMRPWGDVRPDTEVKRDILDAISDAGFHPILAVDDREDIIAVWNTAGIPTIKVVTHGSAPPG